MRPRPLLELFRYRELLFFLVWRDLKIRYKQTVLGAAWAVIQPLFTMIVFAIFFGRLAGILTNGVPYPVFSYSALLPWTYFAAALMNAGNSLVGNTDLITKVYFPRMIIPISAVLIGLVDLAIAAGFLLLLLPYYDIRPSWRILAWPLTIALLVILALGAGLFLAAVNVAYRDVKYALPFAIQMLLFLTPVIYPTTMVPEQFRLALNPLTGIIETARASLLPTGTIDWGLLRTSALGTLVVFVLGAVHFRRAERTFANVV